MPAVTILDLLREAIIILPYVIRFSHDGNVTCSGALCLHCNQRVFIYLYKREKLGH